ncbi:hypothetical protein V6N11_019227 [Hibiscus sabdariffa]|uniref:Uncharacterized protein n=2 Tax=Hibiscus sabdariffa TaxID=183260 RepID=A0ABR2R1S4_9ROSI
MNRLDHAEGSEDPYAMRCQPLDQAKGTSGFGVKQVEVGNESDTAFFDITGIELGLDVGRLLMEGSDGTDHTVENLSRNSMVYDMENPKGSRRGDYLLHDSRMGPLAGMTTDLGLGFRRVDEYGRDGGETRIDQLFYSDF